MPSHGTAIQQVIRTLTHPALGVLRYALTLAVFSGIWWYDARYLNWAFDLNLALIKRVTAALDGSGKAEAMMRAFAGEKLLLFAECSAIISGVGTLLKAGFQRLRRSRRDMESVPAKPVQERAPAVRRRLGDR